MATFPEFRFQKHAEQKQANNANLRQTLALAKLEIENFSLLECTEKNCERVLKRVKVAKGTVTMLKNGGYTRDMAKSRGVSIEKLLNDDQKINSLSIDPSKQTLDEKIQIQYWNMNNPQHQIESISNTGPRFVRKFSDDEVLDEVNLNNAMRDLVSFLPHRLGGPGKAIRSIAKHFHKILKRVDKKKTTIENNNNAERFNSSRSFDGKLKDEHGNFKGYVISMKYQKPTSGGSQDRQKDDVHNTISMCADYIRTNPTEKQIVFYLIMDGGGLGPTFLNELKRHVNQENVANRIFVRTNS